MSEKKKNVLVVVFFIICFALLLITTFIRVEIKQKIEERQEIERFLEQQVESGVIYYDENGILRCQ
jgi:cell division protein FtsI/penicillin-binding protein 2